MDFNGVNKVNRTLSFFLTSQKETKSQSDKRKIRSERKIFAFALRFFKTVAFAPRFEGSSISLHNFDENLHPWQRESSLEARRYP